MYPPQRKRHKPASAFAPRELIILDNGKRLTGRLMHQAFVWTEETLSAAEWQAALAAAAHQPEVTVLPPREPDPRSAGRPQRGQARRR